MDVRIARTNDNDFLPELEAVPQAEFDQLFDDPLPEPASLREGETLGYKFRFLGVVPVRAEKFYLFARLDPYEQAELRKKGESRPQTPVNAEAQPAVNAAAQPADGADTVVRPRRAVEPLNQTPPHP